MNNKKNNSTLVKENVMKDEILSVDQKKNVETNDHSPQSVSYVSSEKINSGWFIDDNENGPALMKVLERLIYKIQIGHRASMVEVNRIWSLMQHGFVQESPAGTWSAQEISGSRFRNCLEEVTKPGVKIVVIDEIGSNDWRKVGDEYAIHIFGSRDGRERHFEVKVGSHAGFNNEVKRLTVSKHGLFFLHPELIARDVKSEEGDYQPIGTKFIPINALVGDAVSVVPIPPTAQSKVY